MWYQPVPLKLFKFINQKATVWMHVTTITSCFVHFFYWIYYYYRIIKVNTLFRRECHSAGTLFEIHMQVSLYVWSLVYVLYGIWVLITISHSIMVGNSWLPCSVSANNLIFLLLVTKVISLEAAGAEFTIRTHKIFPIPCAYKILHMFWVVGISTMVIFLLGLNVFDTLQTEIKSILKPHFQCSSIKLCVKFRFMPVICLLCLTQPTSLLL
jgi:hypothetical protein